MLSREHRICKEAGARANALALRSKNISDPSPLLPPPPPGPQIEAALRILQNWSSEAWEQPTEGLRGHTGQPSPRGPFSSHLSFSPQTAEPGNDASLPWGSVSHHCKPRD